MLARFSGINAKVPNFRSFVKNFSSLGGVGNIYAGFSVALVRNISFVALHLSLLPGLEAGNDYIESRLISLQK